MPVVLVVMLLASGPAERRGLDVVGQGYRATVGPEGNLVSLRVGASEALETLLDDAHGGTLRQRLPVLLDRHQYEHALITVSNQVAAVSYRFDDAQVRIGITNADRGDLEYALTLRPEWSLAGNVASTPWGATLTLATGAPVRAEERTWRVRCPGLDHVALVLVPDPGPRGRPFAQGVWAEPRCLTPGRFVLRAAAPDLSPDGTRLTVPLVLANDLRETVAMSVTTSLDQGGDRLPSTLTEQVRLAGRQALAYDARHPAPPPGVHRLTVTCEAGGQRTVSELVVAYAPECWPAPPPAVAEAPSASRLTLRAEPANGRPAWLRWGVWDGERRCGCGRWPAKGTARGVLLAGWSLVDADALAEVGLATLAVDRATLVPAAADLLLARKPTRWAVAAHGLRAWPRGVPWAAALFAPEPTVVATAPCPVLLGRLASPGRPVYAALNPRFALEDWVYTTDAGSASSHFRAAQRLWLARRL
jgi:hypothetical protein